MEFYSQKNNDKEHTSGRWKPTADITPKNKYTINEQVHKLRLRRPNRINKRWLWIIIAVFILLLIGSVLTIYFFNRSKSIRLSNEVINSTSLDLYFPAKLPAGVTYKENDTKVNFGYVFLTFEHRDGDIIISEQPLTKKLDEKALMPQETFDTPVGKAYKIRNSLEQTQFMVQAPSTLILVSTPQDFDESITRGLIEKLEIQK